MSFKVVPFPFPLPEHEGSSLWYLLWKPGLVSGYRSHKTVRVPIWLIPPLEFLTLRLDCTEQPIIISYYSIGCHGSVCSWVTALVNWCSLYLPICLSNLKGSCLRCVLTSLKDPRRVVDFPDCSVFLFIVRMEWWLPSFSHAEWEPRSAAYNFDLLKDGLEVALVGKKIKD